MAVRERRLSSDLYPPSPCKSGAFSHRYGWRGGCRSIPPPRLTKTCCTIGSIPVQNSILSPRLWLLVRKARHRMENDILAATLRLVTEPSSNFDILATRIRIESRFSRGCLEGCRRRCRAGEQRSENMIWSMYKELEHGINNWARVSGNSIHQNLITFNQIGIGKYCWMVNSVM